MFQRKKKGTILSIETILYLSFIILILWSGISLYPNIVQTSKVKRAQADMAEIAQAVSHYHYDTGEYPASESDLEKLTKSEGDEKTKYYGPWLTEIKKSPWNTDYQYMLYPSGRRFVVYISNKKGDAGSPPSETELSNLSAKHITDDGTLFIVGK